MSSFEGPYRPATVTLLNGTPGVSGVTVARARGANFLVEWIDASAGATHRSQSAAETILLLDGNGARISAGGETAIAPAHSVCVLPAGPVDLSFDAGGAAIILRTDGFEAGSLNAADYAEPHARVAPIGNPYRRIGGPRIQVIAVNDIKAPAAKPRLRIVQSETMSISWIEYTGLRDRTKLTPHNHDDFEQGSLAITGNFTHHIRAPWGANANLWLNDAHLEAPARSLTMIPPPLIHTTEGRGEDRHVLIDVFAPVRHDFFNAGWISNGEFYAPPEGAAHAASKETAL